MQQLGPGRRERTVRVPFGLPTSCALSPTCRWIDRAGQGGQPGCEPQVNTRSQSARPGPSSTHSVRLTLLKLAPRTAVQDGPAVDTATRASSGVATTVGWATASRADRGVVNRRSAT